jgi:hypothetical protein
LVIVVGPAANPAPVPVHFKLLIAILSPPETKAPEDLTSKVTVDEEPVFALAVTLIAPSVAAIVGVVSGSELGKVRVVAPPKSNLAVLETVAVAVKALPSVTAIALPGNKNKPIIRTPTKQSFFIFLPPFSAPQIWEMRETIFFV